MTTTNKTHAVQISTADIETMLAGIADLSGALCETVFDRNAAGILASDTEQDAGQNAIDFVKDTAQLTEGALLLIHSSAKIISELFLNGDAEIRFKD